MEADLSSHCEQFEAGAKDTRVGQKGVQPALEQSEVTYCGIPGN
jgi:hypothetical protein